MRIMNAIVVLAVSTVVVACSTTDTPTGPAVSKAPAYGFNAESPNAALIDIRPGTCNMVGSNPDGSPAFGGLGRVTVVVENNNKLMLSCTGSDILNLSNRAQVYVNFPCNIRGIKDDLIHPAVQSRATVSSEGRASLTCTAEL